MAQFIKHPTLGLGSGRGLAVRGFEPRVGSMLTVDSVEPPWDSLSPSLSASLSLSLSVSLSLSNKLTKKKDKEIDTATPTFSIHHPDVSIAIYIKARPSTSKKITESSAKG